MISKDMTWGQIREELQSYGIILGFGWELILSSFLESCDYIEIHGYGKLAELELIKDGAEVSI